MLFILYGDDDFSRAEALTAVKALAGPPDALAGNLVTLDGKTLTPDQLRGVTQAIPFLADKRIVVVEGLLSRFEPQARRPGRAGKRPPSQETQEAQVQSFVEAARGMPESTALALVDGRLSPQNPAYRALALLGQAKEFPPMRPYVLSRWISERVSKQGGSISRAATESLAALSGADLWKVSTEVDKLLAYASGRAIEAADVELLVSDAREAGVFSLIDAVVEGRQGQALKLMHQLFNAGVAAPQLLAMLGRQLRALAQIKDLEGAGLPSAEMGRRVGMTSEYAFNKALEQSHRFSVVRVRELYGRLLEADRAIKTGRLSEELALEFLARDFAGARLGGGS